MTKVLIVEDEPQLLRALRINLRARDYDVELAADGSTALKTVAVYCPDLIVLDLGLPDMDGVDVIRSVRSWTDTPIIVLSGRAGSMDKVEALDAGADDYITKPFGVEELLARMRAVTRRHTQLGDATTTARIGQYLVDIANHTVQGPGEVRLTPTEWQLLTMLVRNPGKLVGQRELLHTVWGPQYQTETNYLRQYMAQIRRKLEPDPAHPRQLITEPGMGYRFIAATDSIPQ